MMSMKCGSCQRQIPDDSKFCEHCGQKIQPRSSEIPVPVRLNVEDGEAKKVVTHLEFLGYSFTDNGSKDGLIKLFATHKLKNNLFINYASSNGFVIYTIFRINQNKAIKQRGELLEIINQANGGSYLTAFSLTEGEEPVVICGSWYPPEYNKTTFAGFLDLFEKDIAKGFSTEGFMGFA